MMYPSNISQRKSESSTTLMLLIMDRGKLHLGFLVQTQWIFYKYLNPIIDKKSRYSLKNTRRNSPRLYISELTSHSKTLIQPYTKKGYPSLYLFLAITIYFQFQFVIWSCFRLTKQFSL